MSKILHNVAFEAPTVLAFEDRLVVGFGTVTTAAGGSAGAAVATVVTGLLLPPNYNVQATSNQDASVYITNKTQAGFTINQAPRLAANTLASGTVDYLVHA